MTSQADYDSPWKDVLDLFFEAAMEFFFPTAHAQIDWSRGYEFLDKELQKITADVALGRRAVDKLVKVWLNDGQELWVLLHLEVQGQREPDFEHRVYVYHYRSHDRFNVSVASFVILTDEAENWRPTVYQAELLGTEVRLKFSAAKLLDYLPRWEELERSTNPFAVVVQAHLIALQTRNDETGRLQQKLSLTKQLYKRGFSKETIIGLYRFLDWVLVLLPPLALEYEDKLIEFEEEQKMQYVTSIERSGIAKGLQQGLQQGSTRIALQLYQHRFGAPDEATQVQIRALSVEQAEELSAALLGFTTRAEAEAWLREHPPLAAAPVPDSFAN